MRRTRFLVVSLLAGLCSASAYATTYPDLISFAGASYNFDKNDEERESFDYRVEYRSGISLLPLAFERLSFLDPYVQLHPALGIEGNANGVFFFNGGLNLDVPFFHNGILTLGESLGAFADGNDPRPMGSVLQFRSQIELGLRFDNGVRVTGFISHISNASIVCDNPGAEILGAYVHVPLSVFGKE